MGTNWLVNSFFAIEIDGQILECTFAQCILNSCLISWRYVLHTDLCVQAVASVAVAVWERCWSGLGFSGYWFCNYNTQERKHLSSPHFIWRSIDTGQMIAATPLSDPQVNVYIASLFGLQPGHVLVTLNKCRAYSPVRVGGDIVFISWIQDVLFSVCGRLYWHPPTLRGGWQRNKDF